MIRKRIQSRVTRFADWLSARLPGPVAERFERLRLVWDRIIQIRFKHLLYVAFLIGLLVVSFQVQVQALNASTFEDLCANRRLGRAETGELLDHIVDLTDVLPDSEGAELYRVNREALIEKWVHELDEVDCP